MLKKFVLVMGTLWMMSMVACSGDRVAGGGSIDPNTIAEASSSSVALENESSSSEAAVLSSSSREANSSQKESSSSGDNNNGFVPIELSSSSKFRDGGIARTNDFSIRCVDAENERELASAYKSVAGDVVVFALQNVQFDIPCDAAERDEYIEFLNTEKPFLINHEGDTLFVRPFQAEGLDYACSCAASASFSLDKNYSGIGYTAFGRQDPLPVQEN